MDLYNVTSGAQGHEPAIPFPVARWADGRLWFGRQQTRFNKSSGDKLKESARKTHLGRVRIERAIVDIDGEVNGTGEADVLGGGAHRRVREEESHGDQSADDHGIPAAEILPVAQEARGDGAEDAHGVCDHVVPPRVVRAVLAGLGAAAGEELGQEDVEQRIREPDQGPGQPDQTGRDAELLGRKQAAQMCDELGHPVPRAAVRRLDGPAGLELLQRQRARPVVLGRDLLERLDHFFVLALGQQVFRRFFQSDHRHSRNAQHEHERPVRVPYVPPALRVASAVGIRVMADSVTDLVVFICAGRRVQADILRQREEWPGERRSHNGCQSPPARHQGEQPLFVSR